MQLQRCSRVWGSLHSVTDFWPLLLPITSVITRKSPGVKISRLVLTRATFRIWLNACYVCCADKVPSIMAWELYIIAWKLHNNCMDVYTKSAKYMNNSWRRKPKDVYESVYGSKFFGSLSHNQPRRGGTRALSNYKLLTCRGSFSVVSTSN